MEDEKENLPKLNNFLVSSSKNVRSVMENKNRQTRDVVQLLIKENKRLQESKTALEKSHKNRVYISTTPQKIYPDEIIFKDIRVGQTYEINVMVRNQTKYVKRVRILQPRTSKFRCDYDMVGPLAPGIAIELIISFSSNQPGDFHDQVKIVSDDNYEYVLPLHAYSPTSNIIFEPFINMGFVATGKTKTETIKFKNEGNLEGKIELKYSNLTDIKIEPENSFTLQPGQSHEIQMLYTPRDAGIFRGIIEVCVEGQTFMSHIDVNATSVEFQRFVIDEGGNELSKVDFGEVFFGQRNEIKGFLVNNSPKQLAFRVSFIHGQHSNYDESNYLQTPLEAGLEQTQRVMTIEPSSGTIESYSQVPIRFLCKSRVGEDHKIWTKNFCIANDMEGRQALDSLHEYTAQFNFDERDESKVLLMTAKSICPRLKFSSSFLDFGECSANERKDIKVFVENKHTDKEIYLACPNLSTFFAKPERLTLKAGEQKEILVTFKPKNLGRFDKQLEFMLNTYFDLSLRVMGQSLTIGQKTKKIRGPAATAQNFFEKPEYVPENRTLYQFKRAPKLEKMMYSTANESSLPDLYQKSNISEKLDAYQIQKYNKKKYDDFLKQSRVDRVSRKNLKVRQEKMFDIESKIKQYKTKDQDEKEDKALVERPADLACLFNTNRDGLDSPRIDAPQKPDTLYVTKPIGNYEPYDVTTTGQKFTPDPNINFKEFPEKPASHSEVRDCQTELTGEMLQKIQVGPTLIDFEKIFIKSKVHKFFQIKNELRSSIMVRIQATDEELKGSYQKPQIIPSGKIGGFKVELCSAITQNINTTVNYIINEKTHFKFMVKAEVIPVSLQLSRNNVKFSFQDENLDMETSEQIRIINNGNAKGHYEWLVPDSGVFKVDPMSGYVDPYSSVIAAILFHPIGAKGANQTEEELLDLYVVDGNRQRLKCSGQCNEVRCEFMQSSVNFSTIAVSQKAVEYFYLKNYQPRSFAIFQVNAEKLPQGLEIRPMKGKISPEEHFRFEATFMSKNETDIRKDIYINLRGGKAIKVPMIANVIIPKLSITEENFDFGGVTFGNSGTKTITIKNDSSITTIQNLDQRSKDSDQDSAGYQCLQIAYKPQNEEDSVVIEEKEPEDMPLNDWNDLKKMDDKILNDNEDSEVDNDSVRGDKDEKNTRFFKIKLKSNKTYQFELKFSPQRPQIYSFFLPLTLAGYGRIESLNKRVFCKGLTPKFLMDPLNGVLAFKKKTITSSADSQIPENIYINLSNPDMRNALNWRIDTSKLDHDKVFTLFPCEGVLESKDTVCLKATFKPTYSGVYEQNLSLYQDDSTKPYSEVTLKGEGAIPRILFDRRDIVLPIVPLGVESKCVFRVINDGYQSQNLKATVTQDTAVPLPIPIQINYPEGNTLGINNSKIKVEVVFMSKKSLSFSTKIEFEDDNKRYAITVSGTADNSILTNFPFFQRNQDDYKFVAEHGQHIRQVESESDNLSTDNAQAKDSLNFSKANSVGSKSVRSQNIGFKPIPMDQLEKSCDRAKKWINDYIMNADIGKFPDDVIFHNGSQIFDVVEFLTKRTLPMKSKFELSQPKAERVEKLYEQYEQLILFLMENGAMLNTIRPEYLMSHQDIVVYYKNNPKPHTLSAANKITESRFKYISMDSWNVLFFQILKIYYLCRVSTKMFKNLPGIPHEKTHLGEGYNDQNFIYSQNELILFRWLEIQMEENSKVTPRRLKNFDTDLKDSLAFGSTIQNYIGHNLRLVENMKPACISDEDYKHNVDKLREVMIDYGIGGISNPKDILQPSPRDMVLFCVQLFQTLPHYISKTSIDFTCNLEDKITKNIVLSNPSQKSIFYWVRLQGHRDFSIETDAIKIDAKSTCNFPVTFHAKQSMPCTSRITFRNKKDGGVQAAALVFDMISNVVGRESKEKREISNVKLYEIGNIDIPVYNPFDYDAEFIVKIEPILQENKDEIAKKARDKKVPSNNQLKSYHDLQVPSFFCLKDKLKIKKNSSSKVPILYLPINQEVHKCHMIFIDERVGEFQYEIIGTPEYPTTFDTLNFTSNLDHNMTMQIPISESNQYMNMALVKLEGRLKELAKQHIVFDDQIKKITELQNDTNFDISVDPPQFVGITNHFELARKERHHEESEQNEKSKKNEKARTLSTENSVKGDKGESSLQNELSNKIALAITQKIPVKDYPITLTMKNKTLTDVRIYEILVTIFPKVIKASLEMSTPARMAIEQKIPIINSGEKDVNIKIGYQEIKNGSYFSWPHQFVAKKKTTTLFPIKFDPIWIIESEIKQVLNNPQTNDTFEYEIKGIGEEPLAEDHLTINCRVREETVLSISVKNNQDRAIIFKVNNELNHSSGESSIKVKANQTKDYQLSVKPILGGEYTGLITFTSDEGHYQWYTLSVKVESSKCERTIDMQAFVRKTVHSEIELNNPTDGEVCFDVTLEGTGVHGDSKFYLEPNSNASYKVAYSPLAICKDKGQVHFVNDVIGEIWFKLAQKSDENPPHKLPVMRAELGKVEKTTITLENPIPQDVKVYQTLTNSFNFEQSIENIVIPALSHINIDVRYIPSDLENIESGNVLLETQEIGSWTFACHGLGIPPTKFGTKKLHGSLNKDCSGSINFKNPFRETIAVSVMLEADEKSKQVFEVLMHKKKVTIEPLCYLNIPFSFIPKEISDYHADIVVMMNEKLSWKYPVLGITEATSTTVDHSFKTASRVVTEKEIRFSLPGITDIVPGETFVHELNVFTKEFEYSLKKWFTLKPIKNYIDHENEQLVYLAHFKPMKPFKSFAEIILLKPSGGRWRFRIQLESTEPEVDDQILITSPLNTTSSVQFRLNNPNPKASSEFTAEFTHDSASEFSVYPKSGKLEPAVRDGTSFIISYTPVEYGKVKIGKLIIQTDEMYYSYVVKGTFPQYKPPNFTHSRLDNRLDSDVRKKLQSSHHKNRNFLNENISTIKENKLKTFYN